MTAKTAAPGNGVGPLIGTGQKVLDCTNGWQNYFLFEDQPCILVLDLSLGSPNRQESYLSCLVVAHGHFFLIYTLSL